MLSVVCGGSQRGDVLFFYSFFKARFLKWALCCLCLLNFVTVQAEEASSGQLINPEAGFEVALWLDKRYADGRDATYIIGESIELGLKVSSSAYVYLYNIHSDGTVLQIYPNRFESANFLSSENTLYFGIKGDNYHFKVAGPEGQDAFIAIASRQKLSTDSLANFLTSTGIFAVGYHSEQSFIDNLRYELEPVGNTDWSVKRVAINIRE